MKNLEELWSKIASVTKNEVITAVLKDEIEVFKSRIEPHDTGHLYTTISTLENRIKEIKKWKQQYVLQTSNLFLRMYDACWSWVCGDTP